DAEFQKKCLGKMSEIAGAGRTVLFVSHNMNAIERLCRRVMCLRHGKLVAIDDNVGDGIITYVRRGSPGGGVSVWRRAHGFPKSDYSVPEELRMSSANPDAPTGAPFSNKFDFVVNITGQIITSDPALNIGLAVYTEDGLLLFWTFTSDTAEGDWV